MKIPIRDGVFAFGETLIDALYSAFALSTSDPLGINHNILS
jgi:hypothetical protein